MLTDDDFDKGLELRREMFGPGSDAPVLSATALTDKLQEVVTRWCFGDLWLRDGLSLKNRSLITVAMLLALGRPNEVRMHMRGALANGVTAEELREVALHAILYCGIPAGGEGIRALEAVLSEVDPESPLLARDA